MKQTTPCFSSASAGSAGPAMTVDDLMDVGSNSSFLTGKRRKSCVGWACLATVATTLALSESSVIASAAFTASPLHPSSPSRLVAVRNDLTGRVVGAASAASKFPSSSLLCLKMTLTAPETLLREEMKSSSTNKSRKRQSRKSGVQQSKSQESVRSVSSDNIYFLGSSSYLDQLSTLTLDLGSSGYDHVSTRSLTNMSDGGKGIDNDSLSASSREIKSTDKTTSSSSSGRRKNTTKSARASVSDTNRDNVARHRGNIIDTDQMSSFAGPIVEDEKRLVVAHYSAEQPTDATDSSSRLSSTSTDTITQPIIRKTRTRATLKAPSGEMTRPVSKSSTMPGFRNRHMTGRRRAYRDGIRIVEERTGKKVGKFLNNTAANRKRKKASSEAMYKNSASVPDSLIQFTNEIHEESRITPNEEIELGTKAQEAIRLQQMYDNLEMKLNREPTDAEWCAAAGKINMEALQGAIEAGIEAKNQLVISNLRMVQGVVNLYIRNGLGSQYNAGDLMQEGVMALIRAAEKFEPKRGFRFSTYAMYWIRAAVKRNQILQSRVIHVPQRMHETHKRIVVCEKELKKEFGRKPTTSELAAATGLTEAQLKRCIKAMAQECYSLDAEVTNTLNPNKGDRNKDTMYELVEYKPDDGEEETVQRQMLREDLIRTLYKYLKPYEVDLVLLRYGLMDEKKLPPEFSGPLTIAEVSQLVGLKPDKVRRMINNSLQRLRHLLGNEWADFENEFP